MSIKTQCSNPDCGHEYHLSPELAGKTVRCKECKQTFTVTAVSATSVRETRVKKPDMSVVAPADAGKSRVAGSPQRMGRFEVHEKLGGGTFGVVYRAFDPQLEREVALKVPRPGTLDDAEAVERFLREAKAAAQLRHPNIVPIYDAGRDGEQYYIASAFISGHPLEKAVEAGAVEPRRAARIVRELAEAFDYAHGQGILHRDIKPANVMLDDKDHPHVMDFGLARLDTAAKLTQDGAVMGTPAYMSPEQAAGENERVEAASDQYSLGVLFYELLTGQTPFSGPPQIVIVNVLTQAPKPPRALKPDVPRDLETICLKAMAKEPEHRYGSCREFAEDLRRWLAGEPITARRVSYAERLVRWCQRNRVLASLVATAALLLVAVAVVSTVSAVRLKDLATRERNETERANRERTKALELTAANATLAEQGKSADDNARQQTEIAQQKSDLAKQESRRAYQNHYFKQMNLAQHNWETGKYEAIVEQLRQTRPEQTGGEDLRGFEWYYLQRLRLADLHPLIGHTFDGNTATDISCVAYSPDGRRIVSGSSNKTAKVWDAATGQEIRAFKGHNSTVNCAAFSRDGLRIVSGSGGQFGGDYLVKVWNVATGQELLTIEEHPDSLGKRWGSVTSVAFSPDGRQIVVGSSDRSVKVWNAATGKVTHTFEGHREDPGIERVLGQEMRSTEGHTSTVVSVAFSPDGQQIISGGHNGMIKVWDATSGKRVNSKVKESLYGLFGSKEAENRNKVISDIVDCIAFSADGLHIVRASAGDTNMKVWNATTGQETLTLNGHSKFVTSVAFSPDGRRIVSGSWDNTLKVWDTTTGQETLTLKGIGSATKVAFSPDGRQIVSGGGTRLKVWDATTAPECLTFKGHTSNVNCVAFSPNGQRIVSGSRDNTVKVWDVMTGVESLTLKGHSNPVRWAQFSPDGRLIFSGDTQYALKGVNKYTFKVWDATTGQEVGTFSTSSGNSECFDCGIAKFSPDGLRVVAQVIEKHQEKVVEIIKGRRVLISRDRFEGILKVWDTTTGEEVLTFKGNDFGIVKSAAFSPDGCKFVTESVEHIYSHLNKEPNPNAELRIWDATTGQIIHTITEREAGNSGVLFSPDGQRIVTPSGRLLDVTTGQEVSKLKVQFGVTEFSVSCAAFSPDGQRVISIGTLWDVETGQEAFRIPGNFSSVAFSPDGRKIVSGKGDGTVNVLDATDKE